MPCFAFVATNAVLVRKIDNPPLNRKEPIWNQIHIGSWVNKNILKENNLFYVLGSLFFVVGFLCRVYGYRN